MNACSLPLLGAVIGVIASQSSAKEQEFRLTKPDGKLRWRAYCHGLHVGEALRWFAAQASSSSAATRESEFDKISKRSRKRQRRCPFALIKGFFRFCDGDG